MAAPLRFTGGSRGIATPSSALIARHRDKHSGGRTAKRNCRTERPNSHVQPERRERQLCAEYGG
jgi:hypothetical protein